MTMLTREVYKARHAAMRGLMETHELEALAFLTPDYVFYATNYPEGGLAPWERPLAVVVPRQGEPFAHLHELSSNALEDSLRRGVMWVSDVAFYGEHPRVVDRLPLAPQWPETMADLLRAHGLGRGRIGVDALSGPMADVPRLLPRLELVDVGVDLRELRWVKHAEELTVVREAAALSDWAQERYREGIRPGRLATELDWSVGAAIMEEAARRHPGEHVDLFLLGLTGADSACGHGAGTRTDAHIAAGDVVVNIICVRLNGLWVENERTWFCGAPGDLQRRAFAAAGEANEAAIAECRAGNPVCAIDAAAQAVFERTGFGQHVRHRTGHGMGIAGHEFPHDMAFNTRPLRVGEVYSAEPGIYLPGVGGFRQDDTVIVGEQPEVVTTTPKDLAFLVVE
jgi:Xaa-Pro aminopeptidase